MASLVRRTPGDFTDWTLYPESNQNGLPQVNMVTRPAGTPLGQVDYGYAVRAAAEGALSVLNSNATMPSTVTSSSRVVSMNNLNATSPRASSPSQAGFYGPLDRGPVGNINALFGQAIGGAGYGQGPFSNTRYNMVGQVEYITPTDPRHTSQAYKDNWPDLYNQYSSGSINGSQLFNRVGAFEALNDQDRMNTTDFNFGEPPKVRFSFNSTGGGSITGTGLSFGGLRGWSGGSIKNIKIPSIFRF